LVLPGDQPDVTRLGRLPRRHLGRGATRPGALADRPELLAVGAHLDLVVSDHPAGQAVQARLVRERLYAPGLAHVDGDRLRQARGRVELRAPRRLRPVVDHVLGAVGPAPVEAVLAAGAGRELVR